MRRLLIDDQFLAIMKGTRNDPGYLTRIEREYVKFYPDVIPYLYLDKESYVRDAKELATITKHSFWFARFLNWAFKVNINHALYVDNYQIRKVSRMRYWWEVLRGKFGLENHCDERKAEMAKKKLEYYGVAKGYITPRQGYIIATYQNDLIKYYRENHEDLRPSFWRRAFSRKKNMHLPNVGTEEFAEKFTFGDTVLWMAKETDRYQGGTVAQDKDQLIGRLATLCPQDAFLNNNENFNYIYSTYKRLPSALHRHVSSGYYLKNSQLALSVASKAIEDNIGVDFDVLNKLASWPVNPTYYFKQFVLQGLFSEASSMFQRLSQDQIDSLDVVSRQTLADELMIQAKNKLKTGETEESIAKRKNDRSVIGKAADLFSASVIGRFDYISGGRLLGKTEVNFTTLNWGAWSDLAMLAKKLNPDIAEKNQDNLYLFAQYELVQLINEKASTVNPEMSARYQAVMDRIVKLDDEEKQVELLTVNDSVAGILYYKRPASAHALLLTMAKHYLKRYYTDGYNLTDTKTIGSAWVKRFFSANMVNDDVLKRLEGKDRDLEFLATYSFEQSLYPEAMKFVEKISDIHSQASLVITSVDTSKRLVELVNKKLFTLDSPLAIELARRYLRRFYHRDGEKITVTEDENKNIMSALMSSEAADMLSPETIICYARFALKTKNWALASRLLPKITDVTNAAKLLAEDDSYITNMLDINLITKDSELAVSIVSICREKQLTAKVSNVIVRVSGWFGSDATPTDVKKYNTLIARLISEDSDPRLHFGENVRNKKYNAAYLLYKKTPDTAQFAASDRKALSDYYVVESRANDLISAQKKGDVEASGMAQASLRRLKIARDLYPEAGEKEKLALEKNIMLHKRMYAQSMFAHAELQGDQGQILARSIKKFIKCFPDFAQAKGDAVNGAGSDLGVVTAMLVQLKSSGASIVAKAVKSDSDLIPNMLNALDAAFMCAKRECLNDRLDMIKSPHDFRAEHFKSCQKYVNRAVAYLSLGIRVLEAKGKRSGDENKRLAKFYFELGMFKVMFPDQLEKGDLGSVQCLNKAAEINMTNPFYLAFSRDRAGANMSDVWGEFPESLPAREWYFQWKEEFWWKKKIFSTGLGDIHGELKGSNVNRNTSP